MNRPTDIFENPGGRRGIRTPGTRNSYGSLANCWFQPLTHPSGFISELPSIVLKCGAKVRLIFHSTKFSGKYFSKKVYFLLFHGLFPLFSGQLQPHFSYFARTSTAPTSHFVTRNQSTSIHPRLDLPAGSCATKPILAPIHLPSRIWKVSPTDLYLLPLVL